MAACLSAVNMWPLTSKQREAEVILKNTLTGQCSFSLIPAVPWRRCDWCMWTQPYRDQSEGSFLSRHFLYWNQPKTDYRVKIRRQNRGTLCLCPFYLCICYLTKSGSGEYYIGQPAVHITCHILNHILPIEAFLHLMFSAEIPSYKNTAELYGITLAMYHTSPVQTLHILMCTSLYYIKYKTHTDGRPMWMCSYFPQVTGESAL